MKNLCLVLFAGCFLAGCDAQMEPTSRPTQHQWTKAEVVGLSIELIDPVRVEYMYFRPDGVLPLKAGEKNGLVMAPIFYWEIVSGRLRITDGTQLQDEFTLVSRDATTLTVRRHNGKIAKYKLIPIPK
ncbi:MAG: hypothetical protein WCH99_14420 [Verrucomicrobiota bacterium]